MTVLDDLRGRLIGALQLELRNAGASAPATLAASAATRAIDSLQVPALLAYVVAAETAGIQVDAVIAAPAGDAAEQLVEARDGLNTARPEWVDARDVIATDPIMAELLP